MNGKSSERKKESERERENADPRNIFGKSIVTTNINDFGTRVFT